MAPPDLYNVLRLSLRERRMRFADLAREIGVNKASITRWAKGGIPAKRVLDVEKFSGIPRDYLRPDLYPPSEAA